LIKNLNTNSGQPIGVEILRNRNYELVPATEGPSAHLTHDLAIEADPRHEHTEGGVMLTAVDIDERN